MAAVIVVTLSYLSISYIGSEFMPQAETKEFSIEVTLPAGVGLERTASTMQSMEEMILECMKDHIDYVYTHSGPQTNMTGTDDSVFEGENTGFIKVVLNEETAYSTDDFIPVLSQIFSGIRDMEIEFIQDETALSEIVGNDAAPIVVEILGEDLDVLDKLTDRVYAELKKEDQLYNLKSSFEEGVPEVIVTIDKYRAGIFDIEASTIISQLEEFLMGKDGR